MAGAATPISREGWKRTRTVRPDTVEHGNLAGRMGLIWAEAKSMPRSQSGFNARFGLNQRAYMVCGARRLVPSP
jgi:hypothetical protein